MLHIAVEACLLSVFFTAACLGKFTIPTLKAFNASHHVKPSDIFKDTMGSCPQVSINP